MVTKSGSSIRSAAGTKRSCHSLESQAFVGHPLDEPTRVDEVEAGGESVGHEVVPQNLEAPTPTRFGSEEVRLQVRGDHRAGWGDLLGEPERHRPSARTDLETTAARTHTETSHVGASARVQSGLETREPQPLVGPAVVVCVVLHRSPAAQPS